jgi:hypothetical protein
MSLLPRLSPEPWTAAQRGVLIGLTILLAVYVAIRFWLNPTYVSDPQPLVPSRAAELADRLDPNTATADELAALPMIGERRARDIINYRDRFTSEHPGRIAFEEPTDLLAIRGIGGAILQQIRPFLVFPKERPTSGTSQ